jgi:hypothetical protein
MVPSIGIRVEALATNTYVFFVFGGKCASLAALCFMSIF